MKKFALVGAIATLTLAAAACGGGSDTLSEDDYLDELQDLCSQVNGDLADLPEPEDYQDLVRIAEDAQDITRDGLEDLQELKPPKDLERDHEDYVESIENTLDLTDDFIAAAEDEDDAELEDVSAELADENETRNEIAEDIGADDCVDEVEDPDPDPDTTTTTEPDEDPTTTTEPDDDPTTTTDPDDDPDSTTTDPDDTIPAITVPPIDMTMPPDTEPPVMTGSEIGTIDFTDLTLPAGYTFENVESDILVQIQELYASQFTGQIDAIGGAYTTDDATGETFESYLFFWNADLDTATGTAFVESISVADDVASTEEVVTPGGFYADRVVYTDSTEAVIIWGADIAMVVFGDVGSYDSIVALMDLALG